MTIGLKHILLVTAASIAASTAALALEPGPYIGAGIGVHLPQTTNARAQIPTGAAAVNFKGEFDTGFIGIGSLGYKWDGGLRTELEVGYRHASFDKINGTNATGAQKVLNTSANVLYDFRTDTVLTPYLGAGIGVSSNKWRNVSAPGLPTFNGRDATFQWQGIAGVGMRISQRVDAFIDYRYIGTGKNRFGTRPTGSVVTNHTDRSHNIVVGVRFALGSPEPAPMAAAPPPPVQAPAPRSAVQAPPAPPPPPVPEKFIVFFDFDKAALRPDSQKIVTEAADYAKKNGRAHINATGHADTSGTTVYNQGLSERRVETVKAALVRLGIPMSEIVVRAKGETEPLIATGDGVREPQNRRVEITLE